MTIHELTQPTTFAGVSDRVEQAIEKAFWDYDARRKDQSDRDAFKWAIREMMLDIRKPLA